jgi:branched-chain amino acid transport system ATP-binding protein
MSSEQNDGGGRPLLEVNAVSVRFGGIVALDAVSFTVAAGQICGLIGPNGAGKSTLFNCLSRIYPCGSGNIRFDGRDLSRLPRHRMAGIGIGRTFQNLALFRSMTVRDNILVGCHSRHHAGFLRAMLRTGGAGRIEASGAGRMERLIDFLELGPVADRIVADLPFGTQKRVELGRALAAEPKLLLLDEPACGLNHEELENLGTLIRAIRDGFGVTVLLVEHHMSLVMGVSDRIVALNFGRKIAEGTPAEVRRHPEVVQAYLGDDHARAA